MQPSSPPQTDRALWVMVGMVGASAVGVVGAGLVAFAALVLGVAVYSSPPHEYEVVEWPHGYDEPARKHRAADAEAYDVVLDRLDEEGAGDIMTDSEAPHELE